MARRAADRRNIVRRSAYDTSQSTASVQFPTTGGGTDDTIDSLTGVPRPLSSSEAVMPVISFSRHSHSEVGSVDPQGGRRPSDAGIGGVGLEDDVTDFTRHEPENVGAPPATATAHLGSMFEDPVTNVRLRTMLARAGVTSEGLAAVDQKDVLRAVADAVAGLVNPNAAREHARESSALDEEADIAAMERRTASLRSGFHTPAAQPAAAAKPRSKPATAAPTGSLAQQLAVLRAKKLHTERLVRAEEAKLQTLVSIHSRQADAETVTASWDATVNDLRQASEAEPPAAGAPFDDTAARGYPSTIAEEADYGAYGASTIPGFLKCLPPCSPNTVAILEAAVAEAGRRGHGIVATEHWLWAVFNADAR